MKKFLSIILSITMLLSMGTVAFAEETTTSGAREVKGIIKVGTSADFPPFEYMENDKMLGFDIDLMNYIAARIGYGVEFVNMPFDKLIPAVISSEVDCAISAITITKERESVIDYTTTYLIGQTEIDGEIQQEQYAIVFPDNYVQKAKLAEAAGQEFIYTLVNDALKEFIDNGTVDKLIKQCGLNNATAETGYSYFIASVNIGGADEATGILVGEQNKEDNDKLIYGYQVDDTGKILNLSELKKFYIEFAMDNRIDFIPDFDEKDYKTNNPVSTEEFLMLTYYMNKDNLSEDLSMSAELVEKVMKENFGIEKVEHKSQFKGWTYVEEENKYTPYPGGTAEDGIFDVINFNSYKENGKKIYDVTLRAYYLPFLFSKDDSALSDIYNSYVEYTKNEENVYRENVLFLLDEKGEKIKNAEVNIYNALYDLIVEDNTDGFTAGKTIRIKYYIDKTTGNPRFIYKNEEKNTLETSGTPLAPPSDWATADVEKAKALNITTDDVIYRYRMSITREEFCNLAYNYIVEFGKDLEVSNNHKFNDTDSVKVEALSSLGIIKGKTETEFAPNDLLTREEAATILNRLINVVHPDLASTELYFEFADGAKISDWAMSDIQRICNMGIMKGVGNNNFAPKDTYTTEQAIVTLVRVLESAGASGLLDENTSIGIIGGADGPTSIIVGDNVNVIEQEDYDNFYVEVKKNTTKVNDFYVDEAIKLITESGKLASDKDFISLYTANDEMTNKVLALGAVDFNKPTDIFYLYADKEQMIENIKALAGEDAEDINFEQLEKLNKRYNFSTLASLINASYGAENLAALTILTNSRGYIMPKDFKDDFALFVQYEGEYSAIVSFSKFGDGVISANMSFVKNGDKDNVFRRLHEITSAVGEDAVTIAKVK